MDPEQWYRYANNGPIGLSVYALGCHRMFDCYRDIARAQWGLIFGASRNKGDIAALRMDLDVMEVEISIMVTPSEVEDLIWIDGNYWHHVWEVDIVKFWRPSRWYMGHLLRVK